MHAQTLDGRESKSLWQLWRTESKWNPVAERGRVGGSLKEVENSHISFILRQIEILESMAEPQ